MIILQVIAILFVIVCALGFLRLQSELQSILQWIGHVNDKLTRIEYGQPSTKGERAA